MAKKKKKRKKTGLPPGTLEFTGERKAERSLVWQVVYNENHLHQQELAAHKIPGVETGKVNWYDIRGLHDVDLIEQLGKQFDIHPLVQEDILNTQQRPKFEEYGEAVFFVLSSLNFDPDQVQLNTEQIAIYFGRDYLLTFQENPDDTFTAVRERIESGRGRIRSRNSDYLAYALIDNVVDHYFVVLDQIEEQIDLLETEITEHPDKYTKGKIHRLKYQMLTLRKAVMPLREAVSRLSRAECQAVDESTGVFIRDLYDHVIRVADLIETYRDMLNGLQDLYLSELSLRMNNVMQVLTIITTIFVPLTFLAGIYGMNFDNIPELHYFNGYYYLLGIMAVIAVALVFFFRRKNWL